MAVDTAARESDVVAAVHHGRERRSNWLWRFAKRKPLGAFGLLVVVGLILIAAFAPAITPKDPTQFNGLRRLKGPSAQAWFGTDDKGRDIYSRVVYGARVSVSVAFGAVAISTMLGAAIALISGYAGGWLDAILQRVIDACMAFPWLIVLITLVSVFGAGLGQVVIALGVLSSFGLSRVIRSAVLGVKAQSYFEAAGVCGASAPRIILRHVLPNVFAPLVIAATVSMGGLVLAEASLSFLGFGVPPPTPTWGSMLSVEGRAFMERAPWIAIFPGLAIAALVFSFNMLGDALRDVMDPRLRV